MTDSKPLKTEVLQGQGERTTTVGLLVNFLDELRAKMAPVK